MKKQLFALLILLVIVTVQLFAQLDHNSTSWFRKGPFCADVQSLAMAPTNPEVLYLGTYSTGIYKTENGGENWTLCSTENIPFYEDTLFHSPTLPCWWFGDFYPIEALAVDPLDENHVWVGTRLMGLLESTNGGESWQKANSTLPDTLAENYIVINPQASDDILLSTGQNFLLDNGGLYRTLNGGTTWNIVDSLPHGESYGMTTTARDPVDNGHILVVIHSNGEPGFSWGLMETNNDGSTWEEVTDDFRFLNISINPDNTQNIWGVNLNGFGQYWLMLSNDGGHNWETCEGLDNPTKSVTSLYADSDFNLYIESYHSEQSSAKSIFRSEDQGASWFELEKLLDRNNTVGGDVINLTNRCQAETTNTNNIYFGTYYGIFHSEDGGTTNLLQNTGLMNSYIRDVEVHPFKCDIVYASGTQGLWKSTDACRSWEIIHDDYAGNITFDPLFPDTLYCSMFSSSIVKLMRSYDGGITFENITFDVNETITDIAVHPVSTNIIFLYGWSSLYKSEDYGNTWELIINDLPYTKYSNLIIDPQHPDTMYFGKSRSLDGGLTWEKGVLDKRIDAVHPQNSNILYGSSTSGDNNGNDIHVSYDWGLSFHLLDKYSGGVFNGQNIRNFTIAKDNPDYLFYCTSNDGIHFSIDAGANWQQLEGNYEKRTLDIIPLVDEDKYYIASHGDGVWVYDPTYVSVPDLSSPRKENKLLRVAPNPFNEQATIYYETNISGQVNISVYDLQGKRITTLIDEHKTKGEYEIIWNGKDQNAKEIIPGIYLLLFQSGKNTNSCKIVLFK